MRYSRLSFRRARLSSSFPSSRGYVHTVVIVRLNDIRNFLGYPFHRRTRRSSTKSFVVVAERGLFGVCGRISLEMFVQLFRKFCFPKSCIAAVVHMLAVDLEDFCASIDARTEKKAERYILRQVGGLGKIREVGFQQVVQVARCRHFARVW